MNKNELIQEIEKAIRETLVISNKGSMHFAMDKISKLLTTPTPSSVTEEEINWEGFQDYLYNNNYHWENGAFWFDDDEEGNQELSLKELYQWYLEVQN